MRLIPALMMFAVVLALAPVAPGAPNKLRDDSMDRRTPDTSVQVNVTLITASSEKGETDARLAPYADNLKRMLRFESFGFLGQGTTRIQMPGTGEVSLPQGNAVKLQAAHYGAGAVWLRVIWMEGDRERLNVVYARWERGKPLILGGAGAGGENLAIIVTPK